MPEELLEDLTVMMATTPVLEGEMIESASTADVLFWIIHPGIERLLAAKRLAGVTAMNGVPFTQVGSVGWWLVGCGIVMLLTSCLSSSYFYPFISSLFYLPSHLLPLPPHIPPTYRTLSPPLNPLPLSQWADVTGQNETWLHYSYYDLKKKQNPYMTEAYTCYGHQATDLVFPVALPLTETVERGVDMNEDGIVTNWEFFRALDPNLPDNNDYVFDHFDWDHCDKL